MAVIEATTALTEVGQAHAVASASLPAAFDYPLMEWLDATEWAVRRQELKRRYGQQRGLPKELSAEELAALPEEIRRQCEELIRLGLTRKAVRLAYCGRYAHVFQCTQCGRPGKKVWRCKCRMDVRCAPRNFNALFARFQKVDQLIPAAVRSLPGWGWHILDFSFRHDGDYPSKDELHAMVKVIRLTVQRAVREKCREWYEAGRGCRLRLDEDGLPVMFEGWPVGGAPDGEARILVGWEAVLIPEHMRKVKRQDELWGKRVEKITVPARWVLRFGYELVRVTEFGFDNVNAHFHCAYFGPWLDWWEDGPILGGRLVEIFKQESRRELGVESFRVIFQKAARGYRSVLAHALKYTQKIPASTPEGLAQLESVITGTRRVTLLGAHYGVPLEDEKKKPRCPSCRALVEPVKRLGLVPLVEVADLPDVVEDDGRVRDEASDLAGVDFEDALFARRAP